jgi:tRNA dimethylallyltransferase
MDIGTSKPPEDILNKIPHHFINIIYPDQNYSAGQFANEARKVIGAILEQDKKPLVVGGSGLYIRALLEGLFGQNIRDDEIRKQLKTRLENQGAAILYKELESVDPLSAKKIHPNNINRVLRALEVYSIAGKPLSEFQEGKKDPAPFPYIKFGIIMERKKLYNQINNRVERMFENGLVQEVEQILSQGYPKNLNSLNSVGYKEVIDYLGGNMDFETCIEKVKQNTRRYAKRQLTWFRSEKDIQWVSIDQSNDYISVAAEKILSQFIEHCE